MTHISRAELVTSLEYVDTVDPSKSRAVLETSPASQCTGLIEGPRVVIGRAEDSFGVPGMGLWFVLYTAALERCTRKHLYREHVWHFQVSCLALTQ